LYCVNEAADTQVVWLWLHKRKAILFYQSVLTFLFSVFPITLYFCMLTVSFQLSFLLILQLSHLYFLVIFLSPDLHLHLSISFHFSSSVCSLCSGSISQNHPKAKLLSVYVCASAGAHTHTQASLHTQVTFCWSYIYIYIYVTNTIV
jgi:hypothetical protein